MNIVLSILMLLAFALLIGAFVLWRKGGPIRQVSLMIVLAIVAIANVLIWTVPDSEGQAPVQRVEALGQ